MSSMFGPYTVVEADYRRESIARSFREHRTPRRLLPRWHGDTTRSGR